MVQLKIADGMDGGCFHLLMENSCYSLVCFDRIKMKLKQSDVEDHDSKNLFDEKVSHFQYSNYYW